MGYPIVYRPEDQFGRNISPVEAVRRMHQQRTYYGGIGGISPYDPGNPFHRQKEEKLRKEQKEWVRKMKLTEKAERDKRALKAYKQRLQLEKAKGELGDPEREMQQLWSLQDAVEESQFALKGYMTRRKNLAELKANKRVRFLPNRERMERERDPFKSLRDIERWGVSLTDRLKKRGLLP